MRISFRTAALPAPARNSATHRIASRFQTWRRADTGPSYTATAFGPFHRTALCVAFAALVCARMPDVVLHGRFWAEEGSHFFRAAWDGPWYVALLEPFGGYLNIVANVATLLAHATVSLRYAPYVTTAVALLFQLCPAILIVTARASWLQPRWAVLAALLVIATRPVSEEVWLQTLHSQFHLALCAGIILATNVSGGSLLRGFRLSLLFLGPLCGPGAIVFVPFFIARAWLDRTRARWWQAGALTLGSAVQLAFFYSHDPGRSYHLGLELFAEIMFVRHFLLPMFGHAWAIVLARASWTIFHTGWLDALLAAGEAIACVTLAFAALGRPRREAAWLLVSGLAMAMVSYFGALGSPENFLFVDVGPRYSFVPQVLFGLACIAWGVTGPRMGQAIGRVLVAWLLVVGGQDFLIPSADFFGHGPDWAAEVAAWKLDHAHPLAVWPGGDWKIDLSDAPR